MTTEAIGIDVEKMVTEVTDLITLPEIYLKIRELMDDPSSCLDDFAIVANTDPGLVASVLKIVNSAYFGFAGQIDNLNRALNLIGLGQLHDLVLGISAINSLDIPNEIENLTVFWQRSIYCGVLSRLIAEKRKLTNADSLFIIGLLHMIGRLIIFLKYPDETRQAISLAKAENISLTDAERLIFGTDYSQIGLALLAEWNLPLKFQLITGYHTDPGHAVDYIAETNIVHIIHKIAVNKFPLADHYQYQIDQETFAQLGTSENELNALCEEANYLSSEIEKLIFKDKT